MCSILKKIKKNNLINKTLFYNISKFRKYIKARPVFMVYNKTKNLGLGRKIELIFRIQMHVNDGKILFRQN